MKLSGGAFGLTSEEHVLSSVDKRDVGRKMLTKMLGSFLDEDLVGRYKAPDGHALERASLLRNEAAAASALKPRGSLELSVKGADGSPEPDVVLLGGGLSCALKLLPQEGESFPDEGLKLSITAFASEYTGRGRHVLGRKSVTVTPEAAAGEGLLLELNTAGPEFERMHKGTGFPVTVVGTAVWQDVSDDAPAHSVVSLIAEDAIELAAPQIELVSIEPAPELGTRSLVTLQFSKICTRTLSRFACAPVANLQGVRIAENPFADRPLTQAVMMVEGRRLTGRKTIPLPDVEPGATATCEVHISPKARRHERATPEQNLYQLVATLRCAEVEGIYGSVRIDPAPKAEEAVPPASPAPAPAPAPAAKFEHKSGYLAAGNNVAFGRYTLAEAKAKCVELAPKGAVGFTFWGTEAEPPEDELLRCYIKSAKEGGDSGSWQTYMLADAEEAVA